jgi:hypothetical protein
VRQEAGARQGEPLLTAVPASRSAGRETRSALSGRLIVFALTTPEDVLHAVLHLQFLFLEIHFFEMFGFRKVGFGRQLVKPIVELAVLVGEAVEFFVGLQQFLDVL